MTLWSESERRSRGDVPALYLNRVRGTRVQRSPAVDRDSRSGPGVSVVIKMERGDVDGLGRESVRPVAVERFIAELVVAQLSRPRRQPSGCEERLGKLDPDRGGLLDQELQVVRPAQLPATGDEHRLERLLDDLLAMEAENHIGNSTAPVQHIERREILPGLAQQRPRELE